MTNNEKMQKVIAAYSALPYTAITMNRTIKNVYVFEAFKDNLTDDICQAWDEVDCTELHNVLFVSLKTGGSIFKQYKIDGNAQYSK